MTPTGAHRGTWRSNCLGVTVFTMNVYGLARKRTSVSAVRSRGLAYVWLYTYTFLSHLTDNKFLLQFEDPPIKILYRDMTGVHGLNHTKHNIITLWPNAGFMYKLRNYQLVLNGPKRFFSLFTFIVFAV
jgi:hypothetical protein